MAKFTKIEDITAWQKARALSKDVFLFFKNNLKLKREFFLKDQMLRASISIMTNIAEGFARNTDKEFAQFLHIAKGSASELKSLFYTLLDTDLTEQSTFDKFYSKISEIEKMLSSLISYLRKN